MSSYQSNHNNTRDWADGVNMLFNAKAANDIGQLIDEKLERDGSVAWTADQNGGGFNLTNGDLEYTAPGVGAVATTVGVRLDETLSVTGGGAIGDDVVDDAASIQNRIDALSDGGTVTLPIPSVAYKTGSTISVGQGINFQGRGYACRDYALGTLNCAVIKPTGDVRRGILLRNSRGSAIRNLIVDMSAVTAAYTHTIIGISKANPAVVTYSGSDPADGDIIRLTGVGGMTEVNARHFVVASVNTTAKTYTLEGIDSSGFTAFTSGGTATLRPCGIVVNGSWFWNLENVFITGLQNDNCISVCFIASTQGTYWGRVSGIFNWDNAASVGTSFVLQGTIGNSSGRVNQIVFDACNSNTAGDGWLLDECGAGLTFLSCTAENMVRDGVTITNNTNTGYPTFIGGEYGGNGGWGINGLCLVENATITGNATGRVNGGSEIRVLQTGELKLDLDGPIKIYGSGLGFDPTSYIERLQGQFSKTAQSVTGSGTYQIAARADLGTNSIWQVSCHRNGNAQYHVALVETSGSSGPITVTTLAGGTGTVKIQNDGSDNLEISNTGTTADHNFSAVKLTTSDA